MRVDFHANVMTAEGIGEGFSWSPDGANNDRTWWKVTRGTHVFNVRVSHAYRSGPLRMGDYGTLTEFTVWVADQSRAVKATSKAEAETLMLKHSLTADNAEVTELSAHDRYEDVGGLRRIVKLAWRESEIAPLTAEILTRAFHPNVDQGRVRVGHLHKEHQIH